MPDHAHLIVYPTRADYDMGAILRAIKGPVGASAIAYLRAEAPEWLSRISITRGGRTERLFWQSGGGYDRNVTNGKTLLAMIDYLHANPVRKGLCERAELAALHAASRRPSGARSRT